MRRIWLAFGATLAVALPAAAATTAGAALAAPAPRAAAPGAHPGAAGPVAVRHGGNGAGGTRLWLARFIVPPNSVGYALSTVASPDGSQVFITGSGAGSATVAYDAATGAQHWAAPTGLSNGGFVAVSPDGSRVFITGTSPTPVVSCGSRRGPSTPPPGPSCGPRSTAAREPPPPARRPWP